MFGECRWGSRSPVGPGVYHGLRSKIDRLPEPSCRQNPTCVRFSTGGFTPALQALAAEPDERLYLVSGADLLPAYSPQIR